MVGADDKVELRVVEPGTRDGSLQVIEKGLSPGERVVVEGLQKVRAGSVVNPKSAEPAAPAAGRALSAWRAPEARRPATTSSSAARSSRS